MKPFGLAGQLYYGSHDIHLPLVFSTPGTGYSSNVIINGFNAHRIGDVSEPHVLPIPPFPSHPEVLVGTPSKVRINGMPAAAVGTKPAGGGTGVLLGSQTVFFNASPV